MQTKFERIYFENRWAQPRYSRPGNWTIIGISKRYCSWDNFKYSICFFGFSVHIWFQIKVTKEIKFLKYRGTSISGIDFYNFYKFWKVDRRNKS